MDMNLFPLRYTLLIIIFALVPFIQSCSSSEEAESEVTVPEKNIDMKFTDKHTYARPDEAVVKHLDLDIAVDFDAKKISGRASYDIENIEGVETIFMDSRNLNINKVTLGDNEESTEFALGEEKKHLGQPLSIKIKPETKKINIYYSTNPDAAALQWLSPQQTAGKKHPYLFTQSQAILARTWIPSQDGPGIRFTYNARVRVPSQLMALMSAENPQAKNDSGIYHFKMEQPIPSYLMALAVGDFQFRSLGEHTGVYSEPSMIEKSAYEFADMEKMLIAAENLYGAYRWDQYDVIVLPPSFPFGGMENPRLTFATPTILAGDRSLTSLIAHELAHSWSGNLVTNATWEDFWLNEGFTVYFEDRIMEELYGESYANMLRVLQYQDLQDELKNLKEEGKYEDTKLKLQLEGREPDEGLTSIAYDKGSLMLRNIELIVGRERFDAFLKKYFNDHAFQTMTTEKFLQFYNDELIKGDLELANKIKIENWIFSTGLPEDHVVPISERLEKVNAVIKQWKAGSIKAAQIDTAGWTSHEWQHFLRNVPDTLSEEKIRELDAAFQFTQTGNSEVAFLWLKLAIVNKYKPADKRLEEFLMTVGRRKFIKPLYETMAKTEEGLALARKIYSKARPNYHSVSTGSIDPILKWEK